MTATAPVTIPEWDMADRLSKSLRHAGIEPADMAGYLEVHRNTVSNWTHGRTKPPTAAVRLWAWRTGVPYEWLAYGVTGLPHQDSNLEPSGSSHEALSEREPSPSEVLAFRKRIGHMGEIRSSVRSSKVARS